MSLYNMCLLYNHFPIYSYSLVSGEMLPVLDKLTQDDDSDVRYFSDEAIASVK